MEQETSKTRSEVIICEGTKIQYLQFIIIGLHI